MGKKLAILGHSTRGKEVIELLEMMGGSNIHNLSGNDIYSYYIIKGFKNEISDELYIFDNEDIYHFTLEKFLEKYPFKIGDKVIDTADGCPGVVSEMKWDEDVSDMKYFVAFGNGIDFGWYVNDSIEFCKETDTVKPVTNKSERTHEDVIFDSIIWHLRNSVNNGKQNLSGGECEDYFREVVKKNNENKMSDCKKCGLGFGSVRCFGKDCPHNTPKSYAVGLKDGKVIECGVNKETDMNKIKPLFKAGDVVKLKGCPDKNIFWVVMDVIEDGYIFNGGEKCSFDDQHHYEKSNREVINAPDITAKVTDKNHKMGPKSKLPSKYYEDKLEEIKSKREYDELRMPLDDDDKLATEATIMDKKILPPDGYLVGKITRTDNGMLVEYVEKKPKYPTTYEECYDEGNTELHFIYVDKDERDLYESFIQLIRCRNAYWKIAGAEMELDEPWEPDWTNLEQLKYCIWVDVGEFITMTNVRGQHVLAFPTEEMRDAFYENFKKEIEQCKELL